MRVLVTGGTGYIGGRLVPELLAAGHRVRCLARTPAKLADHPWWAQVEVVEGDVLDAEALGRAMAGVDAAYLLVHSMGGGAAAFDEPDRRIAAAVRDAAAAAGVGRLVYLGGLGADDDPRLSAHLRSRHEVGRILAAGPVPVTELRAAVIIGSGSASFEMLRHLTETLPAMVAPRWVHTRCQPVAIRDVLACLVAALDAPEVAGRVVEIGGPDVLTYTEMMHAYADVAGLRRRVILPVPVLTPRLSSLWIGLVTPLPTGLARPLVDSLVNEVVVRDDAAMRRLLPRAALPFRRALELALARVADLDVATTWASADYEDSASPVPTDPAWAGGTVLADEQVVLSTAPPDAVFATVTGIGGDRGYPVADWMWELRGLADKLVGGIGVRRGRRHPDQLRRGDPLDFWRVEALEPDRLLRLRAEMKLPGEAWLEFRVSPHGDGSRLEQRARFHPRGVVGRLYWYALLPFHGMIFRPTALALARTAEERAATGRPVAV